MQSSGYVSGFFDADSLNQNHLLNCA